MRSFFAFLLILTLQSVRAQADLYSRLVSFIGNETRESVTDRLIALNVWSVNDEVSRHLNQEFDKCSVIYEGAKLKGGNKGMIGLTFCLDKDNVTVTIALKKDGITKLISISSDHQRIADELQNKKAGYNIVFDKDGKAVYENIGEGSVFNSINQLITR